MRNLMAAVGAAVVLVACGSAHAQDTVAQFYKGKQLKLYVASTPGGGYDLYGRLLGRYIGKYIPGNPTVVPQNMPGAGGNRLAAYLYNVAPKDGTEFGIIFPGAVLDPLIGTQQVQDDPSKLIYMGSANIETFVCIMRSDAPVKTYADVFKTQITLAASAAGGSTVDMPALENNLLGAQWKVVRGYPGSREISLAVEQGEAQGNCGVGVSSIEVEHPDWQTSGKYRVLAQETNKGHPLAQLVARPAGLQLRQDRRAARSDGTRLQPGSVRPALRDAAERAGGARRRAAQGLHASAPRQGSARRRQEAASRYRADPR